VFFNGLRGRWFPNQTSGKNRGQAHQGWQSYAKFNSHRLEERSSGFPNDSSSGPQLLQYRAGQSRQRQAVFCTNHGGTPSCDRLAQPTTPPFNYAHVNAFTRIESTEWKKYYDAKGSGGTRGISKMANLG